MGFFSSDMTRNKLIVLYFIDQVDGMLSEDQIVRGILNENWLDYFSICQALGDLQEGDLLGYIQKSTGTCLILTQEGEEVLRAFMPRLPESFREKIDFHAIQICQYILQETQYLSSYEWAGKDAFLVSLQILEYGEIIYNAKLCIRSRDDAQRMCDQWEERADDVYRSTVSIMTSD